jgi:hypothetical protein
MQKCVAILTKIHCKEKFLFRLIFEVKQCKIFLECVLHSVFYILAPLINAGIPADYYCVDPRKEDEEKSDVDR